MIGWGIHYVPPPPWHAKFRRLIWCRLFHWHDWSMDDEIYDVCRDCRKKRFYPGNGY